MSLINLGILKGRRGALGVVGGCTGLRASLCGSAGSATVVEASELAFENIAEDEYDEEDDYPDDGSNQR